MARAGMALSTVTTLPALSALAAEWRALENANPVSIFQSFDWVESWATTVMVPENCAEPHILCGRDGTGRLVFLWPLMRTRTHGISVLRWFSEPYAQYGDVICAADQPVGDWLAAALDHLRQSRAADLVYLRHIRADAQATGFLHQRCRVGHLDEGAPRLDLTPYGNDAAYEARYTSQQRKRRKKIRKWLEDAMGPVSFTRLPAGAQAEAALDRAIAEKNAWLEERGRHNRIMGSNRHKEFLKHLLARRDGTVETILTAITAGEKPVSWELGFRHQGSHYAYLTSHVNALTDLSPGRLHMDQSQRLALADGQKVFDLMVPYDQHKESWSSVVTPVEDYYLGLTARGRAYGKAYIDWLRPLLRRAYYAMPQDILRRLKPVLRH
jgi:CelD/BcsL family acetyltransferase involved in cellulose biosynthesis